AAEARARAESRVQQAARGGWRPDAVGDLRFFFQAEDGIRDRNVTGVQTCALPISDGLARKVREVLTLEAVIDRRRRCLQNCAERSEECRVGKECRSRWSGSH